LFSKTSNIQVFLYRICVLAFYQMRGIVFAFLLTLLTALGVSAQDSVIQKPAVAPDSAYVNRQHHLNFLDSVAQANELRQRFVEDSLAMLYVHPDPNRPNLFTKMVQSTFYKGHTFLDIPYVSKKKTGFGRTRPSRDPWVIAIIIALLLYTALLNFSLGSDVKNIFQPFFNKRSGQLDKDERQISTGAFIGLLVLFCLTFGLFLYMLAGYNNVYYSVSGMPLFAWLSLVIFSLTALKFLVLKIIGFLFDVNPIVSDYITTLYLTYFNIAFVFLPIVVCFSLISAALIPVLLAAGVILIVVVFVWIYLRSSAGIISNFRFHKFYLFIYLCALEICPVLVLIKALNL
jgi:hypothetical protein